MSSSIENQTLIHKKEKYNLQQIVRSGGFGKVYLGKRATDGLEVAVKIIQTSCIKRWGNIKNYIVPIEFEFLKMASKARNKSIIRMIDWFQYEHSHYVMVMEQPSNAVDLFSYIQEHGVMREYVAKKVFRKVVEAVADCHKHGVLHRNLTLENILFNPKTLDTRIIDFGCGAKLQKMPFNQIEGSLIYYPPEWVNEKRYDGRNLDCWCLGILLYAMLEGHVPFKNYRELVFPILKFRCIMKNTQICRDLISWMLEEKKENRPTLNQILNHPWLAEPKKHKKHKLTTRIRRTLFDGWR